MRVTVIAPTFNEIDAVPAVLPHIKPEWFDELIVVDNNSSDGTAEWCREHGYRVLTQSVPGYGNGIREALAASTGDIIVEFLPDGSSLPEKIPALVEVIRNGYDFVIASRYRDGAVSEDDDWVTALGNRMFTLATNILFGTKFTDALVGFRCYRRSAYDVVRLDVPHLEWVIQSSIRFGTWGFRTTEIGADEPKRIGGVRKMRPFNTGMRILRVMLQELFHRRPAR